MTTVKDYETVNQDLITSKTAWVRGVALTFEAIPHHVFIKIGTLVLDQQPYEYESEETFQAFIQTYKQELNQGQHRLTIPKARTNAVDEFVYTTEAGIFKVLSGYAQLEWDPTTLTAEEAVSGHFFLAKTNETLGSLMANQSYTVIRFLSSTEVDVQVHQSVQEIAASSQEEAWLMDYLNGRLLIFDESRSVQLKPEQWDPLWVAALNENSAYKQLPNPLTPDLKEFYFSKHDLKRRFGYDVSIAKVVPSGFTLKQSKKGEVKVIHYYHSDLVPQSFLCKCGKHTQQTGPISERICWNCLAMYQENCIQRSVVELERQCQVAPEATSLEPVFVVIHTNQGRTKSGTKREMINLCVMDQDETILFQSYLRPTATISKNNRIRGYLPERLSQAPVFEDIHEAFVQAIRGKLVVFFNAEERRTMYHTYCEERGLNADPLTPCICLKEILIPISYGSKRLHKLAAKHGDLVVKDARGLQMECRALGIPFPDQPSIEKDASLMCQIYRALDQKRWMLHLTTLSA